MSNEDDGQLLGEGAGGVGQVYDRHSRAVFRLAYALLRDVDDANDVVQDTFVLLWRRRRQVTLLDGSSLPWLLTTARFMALASRRKRATREARSASLERAEATQVESFDDADAVRAALAGLPEHDRKVLTLVLVEGRTYAEVAGQLGISVTAVGKRLQRARIRFRTSYSDPAITSPGADE